MSEVSNKRKRTKDEIENFDKLVRSGIIILRPKRQRGRPTKAQKANWEQSGWGTKKWRYAEELKTTSKQNKLEDLIMRYKVAEGKDKDNIYNQICQIYSPDDYIHVWYNKYYYLYSTKDEFISDYYYIFCKVLEGWKPRSTRTQSKYNGKGEFKNYFWSALKNNYRNIIKANSVGKRNLPTRCPICEEWTQSISTHVIKRHNNLLWEQVALYINTWNEVTKCPFCNTFKIPIKAKTREEVIHSIKKHIQSEHIYLLFERFHELYPDCCTLNGQLPMSVNQIENNNNEEDYDIYEQCVVDKPMDILLECDLSDIQIQMIEHVLNGKNNISYNKELYNCTKQEFQQELEDLQQKMIFCGFPGCI